MKKTNDNAQSTKEPKIVRKIIISMITILIILAGALIILGHHYVKTALKPLNRNDKSEQEVNIPMGASNRKIGSILQNDNIIKSGFVFNYYVKSHNINNFRSGYYRFSPSMTLTQIADKLKEGGSSQSFNSIRDKVNVLNGDSVTMIATKVGQRTKYSRKEFLQALQNKTLIKNLAKKYPKLLSSAMKAKNVRYRLEGYLAPSTYNAKNKSLEELITEMVDNTNQELKPYYDRIKRQGMTVHEMLTLASLIDNLTISYRDKQIVSGVLLNRMNYALPLNSKSALNYALNSDKTKFSKKEYQINSPYNLFRNSGTGAGPIDSPSDESIKAVLYPSKRQFGYLYYVYNEKTKRVYYSQNYIAQ